MYEYLFCTLAYPVVCFVSSCMVGIFLLRWSPIWCEQMKLHV